MKTRSELVTWLTNALAYNTSCKREKAGKVHFGYQDLREMLDYLYEGEPSKEEDKLINFDPNKCISITTNTTSMEQNNYWDQD